MRWKLLLIFIVVFLVISVEGKTESGSRTVTKFESGSSSKTLEDGDFVYIDVPISVVLKAFTIDVEGKDNASKVELKIDNKVFLKPNQTSFTSLIEDMDLSKNVSISKCDKICRWKLELECDDGEVVVKSLFINYTYTKTPLFIKYIEDVEWDSGSKDNAFDLDDYFYGSSLEYKNRSSKEHTLEYIDIEVGSNGIVNFIAEAGWSGTGYVYFRGDDETDYVDSNEIKLIVGSGIAKPYQFSPSNSSVSLKKGEQQSFGVSGSGNFSVDWYVNENKVKSNSYTYVYSASSVGVYNVEARIGNTKKVWIISVLEPDIVSPGLPVENKSVCGNNIRESGEDCSNCPADVKCSASSRCENGRCVVIEKSYSWIIWIFVFGLVIFLVVVGVILVKKDKLRVPDFFNKIFKKKKIEIKKEPEKDLEPLRKYLNDNLKKGYKKEDLLNAALKQGWNKEDVDKVLNEQKIPIRKGVLSEELGPLKNYIKDGLRKGYKRQNLVNAAMKIGWTKKQIDKVLKEI